MVRKIVARAAFLGVLGFGLLVGGFAVAGANAPEANAGGCFGWNGPWVNVGWCGDVGYPGVGYPGPGYYPPVYQPYYPPAYNVGHYGHPCW